MITVMDQHSATVVTRGKVGISIQHDRLAKMMMSGTGRPRSQPRTSTFLRPTLSETRAAKRSKIALVTPKLTMKETMAVFETKPNSFSPISGTTVLSSPTIIPTKALITINSENWPRFSQIPRRTRVSSLPELDIANFTRHSCFHVVGVVAVEEPPPRGCQRETGMCHAPSSEE